MDSKIKNLLAEITNTTPSEWSISKLHGDASYRTFYRAECEDGESFIIMQMPDGHASISEEVTKYDGGIRELSFINLQRCLSNAHLPVPHIVHNTKDEKLLVIEDLGDEMLFGLVDGKPDQEQKKWYEMAVDLLVEVQERSKLIDKEHCVAFGKRFDESLLNWEFDHFLEYGIEARGGKKLIAQEKKEFEKFSRKISAEIVKLEFGFTHRDFQSRNLMLKEGKLYMIDFQDALIGPYVYDLVSLLRDSYVKLNMSVVEALIKHYTEKSGRDFNDTLRAFHLVTVQRKLKDAGRFVYIDRVKGNPNFLKNIPTSLEYVKLALHKLGFTDFYAFLKNFVPELSV
ncbi:MAG: phosphotransferase [Pseudomonadota bacterium]